jgi:hypothetical protein
MSTASLKLTGILLLATFVYADDAPRVFVTESSSWEISGGAGASDGSLGAYSTGGARPQTAEIIKTFSERCPKVVINNKKENADYIVVLDHEGGKAFYLHRNKVAVFNAVSGDSIVSKSTYSLGAAVQEACDAINAHWPEHSEGMRAAKEAPATATVTSVSVPQNSAEALHVTSNPDRADIYVDGAFVGNAPATLKLKPGKHTVTVKQAGYKDWSRDLVADVGNEANLAASLEK